jgi:LysR family transcriptional regulator, glycine cleavage system transcriptional activator
MPLRLPPLSGLRLFESAARCGSFKAAANELGLTPGAFTHGIDALEQWLDVQLFERHTRGVVLTAAGRQYLPYVTEGLSTIATGTLRLPARRVENRLSISCAPLFACRVLLPRLHKFQALYPKILVKIEASPLCVRLPSDQVDVAIRNSPNAVPHASCDLLGRISLVPVGKPSYVHDLSRGGALDWSRAALIHTSPANDDWETWCDITQTDTSAARNLVVSTAQVAFEAAVDGLSLAIGRLPLIDNDLETGRLVIAVDHVVPVPTGYWLIKPAGVETRREIVAFRNWLLEEMSQLRWNGHSEGRATSQSA